MFFSIVIPMYNVGKYITDCLESLLRQNMTDYEIVVVDDGSTDNSKEIVQGYCKDNPQINLVTKPNGGQSSARNRGLLEAKGEYIIYLDGDDFIKSEDFLSSVYAEVKRTDADVVMYRYQKYFENRENPYAPAHYNFKCVEGETDFSELINKLAAADAFYGSAWSKTVRRSILIDNNITFNENLKCEDIDWNYRLMEKVKVLSFVDREFVAYRQREGSVTNTADLKSVEDFLYTLELYKERYENPKTPLDSRLKEGFLATLAKYYANLLINYCRLGRHDKKKVKARLKNLADLLKYSVSSRPKMVAKFHRFLGFTLTVTAIGVLDKIK